MRWPPAALINRDYARLWYGQAISTLGDYIFSTTLVLWLAAVLAKGKPWAPAAVSGLLLTIGIAVTLVGPVAGVFVDRWNRRRTMLRTEVVRGTLVGFLLLLSLLPTSGLPIWAWLVAIYLVVFALNAAGQFFGPARLATIGDIVHGESDRARAAGIGQATNATAAILGPPIAAPLLFTIGLQWALLFNAASYAVSYIAIRSIRSDQTQADGQGSRAGPKPSVRREFVAGLRFFTGNSFLVALLVIAVICQLGTGAMNALNVFFVTRNLHVSAHLYGYLGTAFGAGAVIGALAAGRVVKRLSARVTTWVCLFLSGALIIAYSRQTVFLAGLLLYFAVAVPITMMNTAITPLLLAATPREYMGRVVAFLNPAVQLTAMLSVGIAGWLASSVLRNFSSSLAGWRFGPIDTIFTAAGLLVLLAGGYAVVALPRPAAEPCSAPATQMPGGASGQR